MAAILNIIKINLLMTFKLLWKFKWYILVYLVFYYALIMEYLNPPEENSPIWGSEAMHGSWNYISQKVYVGSMKDTLISFFLLFLVGTSNIRNHPLLAKLIFLYPLFGFIAGLIIGILE